jgi:5-methylcytosine-specific restriction protein B
MARQRKRPEHIGAIDRAAVLGAMAKFDELGRDRFLRDHGFAKARTYMVAHEGKLYDAKAIVGVAHGIAHPDQPHRSGKDFHSGRASVGQRLERLGFTMVNDDEAPPEDRLSSAPFITADQAEPSNDVGSSAARYRVADIHAEGCFVPELEIARMISTLEMKKNLILQGPPGTGKTWLARRLGYVMLGTNAPAEALRVVQFHPSLSYEDFVRGYRPAKGNGLELCDGIFLEAVQAAREQPGHPFVLVIEEINRGNPAQIFGEMLTLLENTKRRSQEAIELAYRRDPAERVYIPDNLYVIGTMNVADRSLALVDLALRRRFAFVSLTPRMDTEWRQWCREKCGLGDDLIAAIQGRLTHVNRMIADDRSLGVQFQLGHSFVTPTERLSADTGWDWFHQAVVTEIEPLLNEYWFDQPAKVDEARALLLGRPVA